MWTDEVLSSPRPLQPAGSFGGWRAAAGVVSIIILLLLLLAYSDWLRSETRAKLNNKLSKTTRNILKLPLSDDGLERYMKSDFPYLNHSVNGHYIDPILPSILKSSEKLLASYSGQVQSSEGFFLFTKAEGGPLPNFLLLTDLRIILWAPGVSIEKIISIPYQDMERFDVDTGLIFSDVMISDKTTSVKVSM